MDRGMEFRVLGAVEVRAGGRAVPAGEPRQRAVLAVLLLEAGRPVALETLIGRVWGETAPPGARRSVYAYVARLRRVLGDAADQPLIRTSGGYLLDADPQQVDVLWFRALLARGEARAALDLWRGEPLTGVGGVWADRIRETLRDEHADAVVAWAHTEIRDGRAETVLAPLTELAEQRPLFEPATEALIRALHTAGRPADALIRYDRIRRLLRDELGADPGPALQAAHRVVLRNEPAAVTVRPVPAQLPADVPAFTGRAAELAELDRTGTPPVVCLTGTPGAGKTALAVHWAHRARDRFPDGQLYVNLRGFDPELPVTPLEALGTLLAAVLPHGRAAPAGLDERAAQYRTELACRRMLVVLDNAATVEQVRHLLPGAPTCAVLVTSRDSLAGLVSVHGAHRIALDVLPAPDAAALLRELVGDRVGREPDAAATLVEQCARLPLALRIAAELAASRPGATLRALTTELAGQRRLDLLSDGGDPRAAVRAVFSWSLRHLPAAAVDLFALLGLHPGPWIDALAAAALSGRPVGETLPVLTRAHLIHRVADDRYGLHDLLRAYAAERAADGPAALARLYDHYLGAASAAMQVLYPGEAGRRPPVTERGPLPDIAAPETARDWLHTELPNLTAVAVHAAAHGAPAVTVRLAAILYRYLDGDQHSAAVVVFETARAASRDLGDEPGEAYALNALAYTYAQEGRHPVAIERLEEALRLSSRAGDEVGEARALGNLAMIEEQLGRYENAAQRFEQALHRFRRLGDRTGEAHVRTRLASVEARLGHVGTARGYAERALAMHRRSGHRFGEAWALNSLSEVESHSGRHAAAADGHRQALALFRELGHRSSQAWTLDSLGVGERRLGRYGRAGEHHRQALEIFDDLGERFGQASALNGLGETYDACGDRERALSAYRRALELAVRTGARDQQARAEAGIGEGEAEPDH
ncbi:AfsR/SARP family transcriptional regulator [Actinoplanes lobatus]|uniref:DNA-binding SARP family transcriptional activator/tetratricopeptide (TPR) repeat protein n=1 Tax=Actinoplanes lobatus TaxID=113568 RepID=A0A7W7MJS9_9ACTN|nr:tetratricopeptide repeat protein [Actinoplanes lobatus]MBB4752778.1 DNA-binding SARP family transcriptional activator/tetratricopeptide (TPR) repeat protein [Actinoplanes lobatus]